MDMLSQTVEVPAVFDRRYTVNIINASIGSNSVPYGKYRTKKVEKADENIHSNPTPFKMQKKERNAFT